VSLVATKLAAFAVIGFLPKNKVLSYEDITAALNVFTHSRFCHHVPSTINAAFALHNKMFTSITTHLTSITNTTAKNDEDAKTFLCNLKSTNKWCHCLGGTHHNTKW